VARKRATIPGKKCGAGNGNGTIDTQGHLLAVKVTGAHHSDQQGAKAFLEPLKVSAPIDF
jgi:hypothetical protein